LFLAGVYLLIGVIDFSTGIDIPLIVYMIIIAIYMTIESFSLWVQKNGPYWKSNFFMIGIVAIVFWTVVIKMALR
jgi:hypothetical protein